MSVVNLQEAYAQALLVDRRAPADGQQQGDVLGGHELLSEAHVTDVSEAHVTDVRSLCPKVQGDAGAAADPVAELRAMGYTTRAVTTRR
ncbi:MAG: hypothetical protein ACHQCG_00690 [Solirubrobacterales bacterium]